MGKIVLSEKQYKTLKKSLIENTIYGNKGLLNEVSYFNGYIDVDFVNLTLKLNNYLDLERQGGGSELRLNSGVVFKRGQALGSNLVAKNVKFQLVGDYVGDVEEEGTGTITYYCKTKNVDIQGRSALFYGENWARDVQKGFDDLCNQKPLATTPAASSNAGVEKIKNESRAKWKPWTCIINKGKENINSKGHIRYDIGVYRIYMDGNQPTIYQPGVNDDKDIRVIKDCSDPLLVGGQPKTQQKQQTQQKQPKTYDGGGGSGGSGGGRISVPSLDW